MKLLAWMGQHYHTEHILLHGNTSEVFLPGRSRGEPEVENLMCWRLRVMVGVVDDVAVEVWEVYRSFLPAATVVVVAVVLAVVIGR